MHVKKQPTQICMVSAIYRYICSVLLHDPFHVVVDIPVLMCADVCDIMCYNCNLTMEFTATIGRGYQNGENLERHGRSGTLVWEEEL